MRIAGMRISTELLVLREFVMGDWPVVGAWQSDPAHLQYYPWTERTEDDVRRFVQTFVDWQAEEPRRKFQLAMTLPEDGRLIGGCGIRRKAEYDWEAEIGYELAPTYWGNGYATEAARAIVTFGFEELKLHRISSWCIADNQASAGVLERAGLRPEGRLRENEHFKDRYWDTRLFGLLESEWRASCQQ